MIRLISLLAMAVFFSACAGLQNTTYTDDLYYVPANDKMAQETDDSENNTGITENREELANEKAESYDGFADNYDNEKGQYEDQYDDDYVVMNYSDRLRRFHDVYVYDPYYFNDPWYNYYPSVGYSYYGYNSRWRWYVGWGYDWHSPYHHYPYGYYSSWYYPGSYWMGYYNGYHTGLYSSYYYGTNDGIYRSHRNGRNIYSQRSYTASDNRNELNNRGRIKSENTSRNASGANTSSAVGRTTPTSALTRSVDKSKSAAS